jgi:membrane peptidoglycan carboxypeptidase
MSAQRQQQLFGLLLTRRHRRLALRRRSLPARSRQAFVVTAAIIGLALAISLLALAAAYASLTRDLPSLEQIPQVWFNPQNGLLLLPTQIYDRSGQVLLYSLENSGILRRYLPLDAYNPEGLSQALVQVTVFTLDPTFWQNPGFDLRSLGSPDPATIAERLVDELLLADEPAGLRRALRRQLLAGQLVAKYGRTKVLEWYLNSAYFGHLAYGAEAAAQLYLGKPASQINLAEAALLVGALTSPALNPLDAPAAALEGQRQVLDRLLVQGQISQEQFTAAQSTSLSLRLAADQPAEPGRAFVSLVLDDLARRFGRTRLEHGGLKVVTTLDASLQDQLICTLQLQLSRLEGKIAPDALPASTSCPAARLLPALQADQKPLPPGLRSSAILLAPDSGQVLAYVGDSTTGGELVQPAIHQPGSLLTPFLAVAAFSRGMSPASLVWDVPPASDLPPASTNSDVKAVYRGPERLRMALANESLVPLNQILQQIGPANVWQLAEPLGLEGLTQVANPAGLLQSGGDTSLVQLAQAYGVFANLGTLAGQSAGAGAALRPVSVLSVSDIQGRRLYDYQQSETRSVLSPQLAYLVHNVLSDESARWPSLGYPNALEIGRPAGAKTGTSDEGHQVWAAGYTHQLTAVDWISVPDSSTLGLKPEAAAGLWHALMQYATLDQPVASWDQPPGISTVEVCDPSGLLPTPTCPTRVSEVFLNGNEPVGPDTLYYSVQINRETGLLATVFTPPELVEERTYMALPPEAQAWGRLAGLPVPPSDYDRIQPPAPLPDVVISQPAMFAYVSGVATLKGTAAGTDFASYRLQVGQGLNPIAWLQTGSGDSPINDGVLGAWDTRAQDGLFAVRLQVVRQDQTIETATIQVTVDNSPPLVQLIFPQPGDRIQAGGLPVLFQVEASDNVAVQKVEYRLDGRTLGVSDQSPFSLSWQPTAGQHTLVVTAYDLAGNHSDSIPFEFNVN